MRPLFSLFLTALLFAASSFMHTLSDMRAYPVVRPPCNLSSSPKESAPDERTEKAYAQACSINGDVKAWLYIPGTSVNGPVLQDEEYGYLRKALDGTYSETGSLTLDYECILEPGMGLPQNTIIYGVSLGAGREGPEGGTLYFDDFDAENFGQLTRFTQEDFARAVPYIYLTAGTVEYTYEVFSVGYTEARSQPVSYIYPVYSPSRFRKLVRDFRSRSIYSYAAPVYTDDRILTLSTDSYRWDHSWYSEEREKLVIMARLVREGEAGKAAAELEKNENVKLPLTVE